MRRAIVALGMLLAACQSSTPPTAASATRVPMAAPATDAAPAALSESRVVLAEFPVPARSLPHDVAVTPDGVVWYTAQGAGDLGRFDPRTNESMRIKLGASSAPHGVILGPAGTPWVTDGGQNAIVRVDPKGFEVRTYQLPVSRNVSLNTATFDRAGVLWFTGQGGVYGRLDPREGAVRVFDAPRGPGPYGITTTPDGAVYYASLAGSYVGRIDVTSGAATVLEPPTRGQGAQRVWSDSKGRVWVSEWNAGQLARYEPASNAWREWQLPGDRPAAYAVFVDDEDMVWLTDWGANAFVRFDPTREAFTVFLYPANGNVRQLHGRHGEVWGALSRLDRLIVARRQ